MTRLEIIGELKYSGLESGTTNWKQGTMVLHSKDGCWKLDLHINCNRRGPVQSFQINSNTIKKILLREKIYFIELFMQTKGGACNIYFRPDTRSLAKTREFDAVMQDIKKNKIEQSQTPCKACAEKSVNSAEQQAQDSIADPLIVYEVDIPAETLIKPVPSQTLTAEDTSRASHARTRVVATPKKRTNKDQAVMSLVEVKRQRNAVEARKAAALERIATALEAKLKK